jgi:hypothetical protein
MVKVGDRPSRVFAVSFFFLCFHRGGSVPSIVAQERVFAFAILIVEVNRNLHIIGKTLWNYRILSSKKKTQGS